MSEQTEQIEAEVRELAAPPATVPALECWEVWYVDPEAHVWEMCRVGGTPGERAEHIARLRKHGVVHVSTVHWTLPALTIEAKEV